MWLRCGDFILKDGLRVQKACTNVTGSVRKSSVISAGCESALRVLSTAPKIIRTIFILQRDFSTGTHPPLGRKRTFHLSNAMSALPPKADIRWRGLHVWSVQPPEIGTAAKWCLFDQYD